MKKKVQRLVLGASLLSLGIFPAITLAQYSSDGHRTFCVAELKVQSSDARINLRSGPSQTDKVLGYGVPGDLVHILGQKPPEPDIAKDNQGSDWYRVGFPDSKAIGWVRSDLLEHYCLIDSND